jgi:hypothetical protein
MIIDGVHVEYAHPDCALFAAFVLGCESRWIMHGIDNANAQRGLTASAAFHPQQ